MVLFFLSAHFNFNCCLHSILFALLSNEKQKLIWLNIVIYFLNTGQIIDRIFNCASHSTHEFDGRHGHWKLEFTHLPLLQNHYSCPSQWFGEDTDQSIVMGKHIDFSSSFFYCAKRKYLAKCHFVNFRYFFNRIASSFLCFFFCSHFLICRRTKRKST